MDIETFSNILAIAEDKSISKAANRLFVSRSALNRQLLMVEKEIGLPLFKRVSNRLELTYAGEVFIRTAENVLRELRSCTRLMHDISGNVRGMISVGITNGRAGIMMKDIIAKFHERYPHVSISFRITNSDELRELLYTGKVDIALIASEEVTSDFSAEQLSKEEVVLICSSRHPLAHLAGWNEDGTRRQCSLEWFKDEVFGLEPRGTPIRTHADHLFANENFRPDTTIENCTASLLLQLTGDGICCTIFSERHIANNSELVGFGFEPRRYFSISLACRKDYQPNAVERYFMDVTREFYGAAGQQQRA